MGRDAAADTALAAAAAAESALSTASYVLYYILFYYVIRYHLYLYIYISIQLSLSLYIYIDKSHKYIYIYICTCICTVRFLLPPTPHPDWRPPSGEAHGGGQGRRVGGGRLITVGSPNHSSERAAMQGAHARTRKIYAHVDVPACRDTDANADADATTKFLCSYGLFDVCDAVQPFPICCDTSIHGPFLCPMRLSLSEERRQIGAARGISFYLAGVRSVSIISIFELSI